MRLPLKQFIFQLMINSGWKIGYGSDRRGKTIIELIPTEEDISNWSKMLISNSLKVQAIHQAF